ncbi:phosphoribosylformylglycinamidine synthase subunit PurQ [Tepiditoga spiralis]|uniref:phosphoribosylformylglycinamidine synthase subunit PurQ n=1 Tax=Tepiditoga spiralis TaxID=2108365 RepID=UPI0016864236
MKAGIIVFPGSNCDRDAEFALNSCGFETEYIWHDYDNILKYDFIFIPGGFSYGDYLRAGALAKFSPVMKHVEKFAIEKKGLIMGVCNGFQILTETGMLPGALSKNTSLKFICKDVDVNVESFETPFTKYIEKKKLRLPIAHSEGNFKIEKKDIELIKDKVAFKYVENPNGSYEDIAGIFNKNLNILGMMPHPERNSVKTLGNGDGAYIFLSIRRYLEDAKNN